MLPNNSLYILHGSNQNIAPNVAAMRAVKDYFFYSLNNKVQSEMQCSLGSTAMIMIITHLHKSGLS